MISERSGQLQELRRQLTSREQELQDVNRERERDVSAARELPRLQNLLKEKDSFIQVRLSEYIYKMKKMKYIYCFHHCDDYFI